MTGEYAPNTSPYCARVDSMYIKRCAASRVAIDTSRGRCGDVVVVVLSSLASRLKFTIRICAARTALTWCAAIIGSLALPNVMSAQAPPVDVILTGGKVFTSDPSKPWVEAIAVRGNHIAAVGSNADVERLGGERTRRIALAGRTVVPGFDDAHAHVGLSGPHSVDVTVDPSSTPDPLLPALLDSLAAEAQRTPTAVWTTASVGGRVSSTPTGSDATRSPASRSGGLSSSRTPRTSQARRSRTRAAERSDCVASP